MFRNSASVTSDANPIFPSTKFLIKLNKQIRSHKAIAIEVGIFIKPEFVEDEKTHQKLEVCGLKLVIQIEDMFVMKGDAKSILNASKLACVKEITEMGFVYALESSNEQHNEIKPRSP